MSQPERPRTKAHFEALRKRADSLQPYSHLLEGMLVKCVCQDMSSHLEFRPQQLEELDGGDESSSSEFFDSDEEITKALTVPAQPRRQPWRPGGLVLHGITSPFRFIDRIPRKVPTIINAVEDSNASYVALDRKEHDKTLDLAFKFFTYAPSASCPPFSSDDPHIRAAKTPEYLVNAAKAYLEAECQRPDISLVHALASLETYHANDGGGIMGELSRNYILGYVAESAFQVSTWVKSGLLGHEQMNVCWASHFGRESHGPVDRPQIPLPVVDSESDQIPWRYSNITPQPNLGSLAFSHKIIDAINDLRLPGRARDELTKADEHVTKLDLELNNWKSLLPSHLDITPGNRAKPTPQGLMLHCEYLWCSILLYRAFFSRRGRSPRNGHPELNHAKRAAESILELVGTWSCSSVRALSSCCSRSKRQLASVSRNGSLETVLAQAQLCVRYLHEVVPPETETQTSSLVQSQEASFFSSDATPYTNSWNLPPEPGPEWDPVAMNYFAQPQADVPGFGPYPSVRRRNALPEWDPSKFLSTLDSMGVLVLWEQQNLVGIDISRHFQSPRSRRAIRTFANSMPAFAVIFKRRWLRSLHAAVAAEKLRTFVILCIFIFNAAVAACEPVF
ncbi:hypothetical protein DFH07DRAFT_936634 [Mycena maculata]|uniref:Transcription factor domain-containing protein n=1 Tax=Mycena maculata TaxID=230809 RepID=A0AAD7NW62_9AGAR|nr:hypothetical protein DFH07DRAFT_936634 [Mycena maculata]